MNHNYGMDYGRIKLRPMSEKESESYRKLRNQDDVRKWFINSSIIKRDEHEKWYCEYLTQSGEYMFSIYNLNEEFIGGVSIYNINSIECCAEFGRLIINKRLVIEKGMGLDATIAILKIAKSQLFLKKLILEVYENNFAAVSTYKKAGFIITGIRQDKEGKNIFCMKNDLVNII